jgi:hypothetical protein
MKRLKCIGRWVSFPLLSVVSFWLGTHYLAGLTGDVVTEDGRQVGGIQAYDTRDGSTIVKTRRAFVILDLEAHRLVAFDYGAVIEFGPFLFTLDRLPLYVSSSAPLEDWGPNPKFERYEVTFRDLDKKKIKVVFEPREGG